MRNIFICATRRLQNRVEKSRIYVVARHGAAAEAVKAAAAEIKPCFNLPDPVILAVGEELALCLDAVGIHRGDDPDLKRLLAALEK